MAATVAMVGTAACQWEVPNDPFIDSGIDGADPDAGTDAPNDAPTDGAPMATLTVIRSGTASGTITSNAVAGSMIDCGAVCTASFPPGTLVTLTETPGTGATFVGWTGICNDTSPNCSFTLDNDTTLQATFDISRHTITITPTGNGAGNVTSNVGGIACPGTCETTVDYGTALTLTATPVSPSIFAGWNDVGCSGTTPCTFTVTQDEVIDAPFALNYSVTVSKNGNGRGTVTSAPPGINCGADCDQVYSAGTMVTLTAAADPDSDFTGWGGACTGMGTGTCSVTVSAVVSVTANFALKRYTLTATRSGTGGGVVTSNPTGINCGTDCDEIYDHGTQVTLSAMADGSSTFTGWSDPGCTGTGACVVTLTAARSVGATFTLNRYPLTVARSGNGASLGTVTSTPSGINCGTDCDELYDANSMVTLSAATAAGATFMGWSGGGCTGGGNCVVTMSGAQSVTATFVLNQYTLSVLKAGNGAAMGTVTSSPAGITCGADCSEPYQFGQSVTLTPTAMSGATFAGWSGGGCNGSGNCVVTIGGDTAVTATFTLDTYTLAVVRAGNAAGTGSVTSAPAGITCNSTMNDCDQGYTFGTSVTLTAAAGAGSTFGGWSGGGCSGAGTCVVTVDAAKTVSATFTLDEALTVTKAGTGSAYGTVTSAPAGINCGNDCSENFGVGQMVTLTASVQAGAATFTSWGGACAGTQTTCTVTVAAATNAIATFTIDPYLLTAARAGDGSGSIESNIAGITCGADCTESYGYGTSVTLTATPDAGATFTGWSGGGCSGTGACTVTVTAATTVTGTFQADRLLTVTTAGNGSGSVSSAPGGINCPNDCTETYTHGQMVTLMATPSTGSTFTGWSGGGCGGNMGCTVNMTAARTVQATFALTTHTLTITRAGSGSALGTVSSMPAGISCGGDCTEPVTYGSQLTLNASAAAGATFTGWSGGGCNGTGACVVTITANTGVTATFEADQTLTVARGGTGSAYGLVTSTVAGVNCGNDCSEPYPYDSFVDLNASVPIGAAATFASWSGGGCSGSQATCTVRMNQAQSVTASFTIRQHTVSVATNGGNGAGTVTSTPMGINAPTMPSASFNYGTSVTLAASPSTGSNFSGWSGVSGCSGTGSCDVLVDGAKAVTASFTLQQFALNVTKTGTGTALGTITSSLAGIDCGATCSAMYNYNQSVQLSVALMPGVRFMGWSGEGCSGTGTCTVAMTATRNVSAAFEADKTLSVTVNGTGSGTVVSSPAGIMTPADTSEAYTHGTSVTLTAAANATTSNFTGWGGACASFGTAADCVVTMDQAQNVTATFTLKTYTLTLNKTGAGVGTVTSDLAGINCASACTTQNATYSHGQTVVLSQLPGADSAFVAWGGSCTGASCSVAMTQDRTVTANFKRTDKTLTVSVAGAGSGTVTSLDGGINAPTDPSEVYPHGTMVTLMAVPNATTSDFDSWGGACSGSLVTCSVTMDQARSVTANFKLKIRTLTVAKAGYGSGIVTSTSPAGAINCGADCTEDVDHGTMVSLTASPSAGDVFYGWAGGGCTGTGSCTTTVTAATTVTATFDQCDRTQAEVCTDATSFYEACTTAGQSTRTMTCSLGCSTTSEKCLELVPSNNLTSYLDMTESAPGASLSGTSTINTSTGQVCTGGVCDCFGPNPCGPIPSAMVSGMRVFMVSSLSISGNAKVTGTAPLVFLSYGDVNITGVLDLSADGNTNGPGAVASASTCHGGAQAAQNPSPGGGGAGRGTSGGQGGFTGTNVPGGSAGMALSDSTLIPLQGGCSGGLSAYPMPPFQVTALGGGGGGAIQIVSRTIVNVVTGGAIDASGGGGRSTPSAGGGGGGSGGGILIEAPTVVINGANAVVSTKGGGGGGAATTVEVPGEDGGTGANPASGGSNGVTASGGIGGDGTNSPSAGVSGSGPSGDGGGGGGAAGLTRINTRTGAGSLTIGGGGAIRSVRVTGVLPSRQYP